MNWNKDHSLPSLFKRYGMNHLIPILLLFVVSSCGFYSFTGTNISPLVKTVRVGYFNNYSGGGPGNLSQDFTQALQDIYQNNTKLNVISEGKAEIEVEGEITGYQTTPVAPQSSGTDQQVDLTSTTRLTITVKVNYVNSIDEDQSFEKSFSFFEDFEATQTLESVEDGLIQKINEQIVLDIFNATVANW